MQSPLAAAAALGLTLLAVPGGAQHLWLDVEVLSTGPESARVRITNLSRHNLHPVGPRSWGRSNYVKVGFETVAFSTRRPDGEWAHERPDLDMGLADVHWLPLDELVRADLFPDVPVEVELALPPATERGNVELVVLGRRARTRWLHYRRTIGRRVLLPGDATAAVSRALLLALLVLVAWRARRRACPAGPVRLTTRSAVAHSAVALAAAALLLQQLHALHYREFPHSDGVSYANVARSHSRGHGLTSPVIQPGLMTLVPTNRAGQTFVIQAPLWPLVLSAAFRTFGAAPLTVSLTGYALGALTALAVWWIAVLASKRTWVGYLGVLLLLTDAAWFAAVSNGSTVSLQSLLASGIVLLMWSPLRVRTALTAGALVGLGLVTRENTVFFALGLAFVWLPELLAVVRRRGWLRTAALVLAGSVAACIPPALEGARKQEALGRVGHPTLRATLLYGSPVIDRGWYWRYDHPGLRVDPVEYYRENPEVLWAKVRQQVGGVFFRDTLPALLSPSPWFLPVVLPWLLVDRRSCRAGWAVLLALALQVLGASVSFLHPSYFLVFVPALCALVAASAHALLERAFGAAGLGRRALLIALVAYAAGPIAADLGPVTRPGGVDMGEYWYDPRAVEGITRFVRTHTPPGAVIAFGHQPAPLLAWYTGRTVVSYDPAPGTRPSDSPMWRRIDRQLRLDFILLSAMTDVRTDDVLDGFELVASDDVTWLFGRVSERSAADAILPPLHAREGQ